MWAYHDGVWLLTVFPLITVRNIEGMWMAFWGGYLVQSINSSTSAATVMKRTFDYFDARIDLVSTEKVERMMKGNKVYV